MRFDSDQDYMDYLAEPEEEMDAEWESLLNHQPATEPMSLDDWEDREFSEAWERLQLEIGRTWEYIASMACAA